MVNRADLLKRLAAGVLLAAWVGADALAAQEPSLAVVRERTLQILGEVQAREVPLGPIPAEMGRVLELPVAAPGAEGLRLHFVVERETEPPGAWGLQLVGRDGGVAWSLAGSELDRPGVWSGVVDGDTATVQVFRTSREGDLRLSIDELAVMVTRSTPLSIVGDDDLATILHQDPRWVELGRSVARIDFVGEDDKLYTCTGFVVASDLLLTNQHCLATDDETRSAVVYFDYDREDGPADKASLRRLEVDDPCLDYSLVRLKRKTSRTPLRLRPSGLDRDLPLVIIQHPGGRPKQISIPGCQVRQSLVQGSCAGRATDFEHLCDTMGGSSGSPIFDRETGDVIGLHHFGFDEELVGTDVESHLLNQGVDIERVLLDLSDRRPELHAAITAGPPAPSP